MQKLALALIATLVIAGCVGQTPTKIESEKEAETFKPTGVTREFTISGITDIAKGTFNYSKDNIIVNYGDMVKIIFTTTDVSTGHTFNIDEFDVRTATVSGGAKQSIEFLADKKGTFKYYCNLGDHRAKGMEGTLVVE